MRKISLFLLLTSIAFILLPPYPTHAEYNPTTGRFLQRDHMEYVEGFNLYEYVTSKPNLRIDPKGFWGEDFHRWETMSLAILAGFCDPIDVGNWAIAPDWDERRNAPDAFKRYLWHVIFGVYIFNPGEWQETIRRLRNAQDWHFPLVGEEVIPADRGNPAAMTEVERGIWECNLERFSEGLHIVQDSFSHRGRPPMTIWIPGEGVFRLGHRVSENDWLDLTGLLSALSHDADRTHLYPEWAQRAALFTYDLMLQFLNNCECFRCHESRPFDQVRRMINNQYTEEGVRNEEMYNVLLNYVRERLREWL